MSAVFSVRSQLHVSIACVALFVAACGSSSGGGSGVTAGQTDASGNDAVTTTPTTEAGSTMEGGAGDDSAAAEGGSDGVALTACENPLPDGYTCPKVTTVAGKSVCNDDDIQTFFDACWSSTSTTATCSAWGTAHATCKPCTDAWTYPSGSAASASCYLLIDKTATDCASADTCADDCLNAQACSSCSNQTDYNDCVTAATAPGGVCFTVANLTTLTACQGNAKYAACQVKSDADVLKFYRGACRDGGDWSKAGGPLGDAGTSETGTDGGASDAAATDAASDAAPADAASEAATDAGSDAAATG